MDVDGGFVLFKTLDQSLPSSVFAFLTTGTQAGPLSRASCCGDGALWDAALSKMARSRAAVALTRTPQSRIWRSGPLSEKLRNEGAAATSPPLAPRAFSRSPLQTSTPCHFHTGKEGMECGRDLGGLWHYPFLQSSRPALQSFRTGRACSARHACRLLPGKPAPSDAETSLGCTERIKASAQPGL